MNSLLQDLRYGLRQLRLNPGFTAVAVLTAALGIGANTAVFSLAHAILLQPVPYSEPETLVRLWQELPALGREKLPVSAPEYLDYRQQTQSFAELAAYRYLWTDLRGAIEPEQVLALRASANLFSILRVKPRIGRFYTSQDELSNGSPVVVLSSQFWEKRFQSDPRVLERTLELDGQSYRIVGVLPAGLEFPATASSSPEDIPAVWIPLIFNAKERADRSGSFGMNVIGRLRRGVSLVESQHEVAQAAAIISGRYPDAYRGNSRLSATVEPWGADDRSRAKPLLLLLAAAVTMVLLIGCANIASLLLARAGARRKEMTIRAALGASMGRLAQQVLLESITITTIGGLLGLALAELLTRWASLIETDELSFHAVRVNIAALAFTLLLSVLTGLVCGLAPVWHGSRPVAAHRSDRLRGLLISGESAAAMVLLAAAGLLLHSFLRVLQTPSGFQADGVVLLSAKFDPQRYPTMERRTQAQRAMLAKLSALPGVTSVGLTTNLPLTSVKPIGFHIEGQDAFSPHIAAAELVDEGYFRAMSIPLLQGRAFTPHDTPATPLVAIVNNTMARRYWPRRNAIGQRVIWGERALNVVGIVADVHHSALDHEVEPAVYMPTFQVESVANARATFLLRSAPANQPLFTTATAALRSVDPSLIVTAGTTLREVVSQSTRTRRLLLTLLSGFAGIALTLALIGIYGVLSYTIQQRRQELAVRLALGSTPSGVIRLVVLRGLRLTLIGLLAGLAMALAAGRLLSTFLYQVSPADLFALSSASILLVITATLAAFFPAMRAARLDPMESFRSE